MTDWQVWTPEIALFSKGKAPQLWNILQCPGKYSGNGFRLRVEAQFTKKSYYIQIIIINILLFKKYKCKSINLVHRTVSYQHHVQYLFLKDFWIFLLIKQIYVTTLQFIVSSIWIYINIYMCMYMYVTIEQIGLMEL
jgi:hypothetical protein